MAPPGESRPYQPFAIGDEDLDVVASLGVVPGAHDLQVALAAADAAMYRAKQRGGGIEVVRA